jgi:hypothetical protein
MGIMQSIRSQIDAILRAETELAQKDDPSLIVRSAFEVIEDYLSKGMSLERIASALQKHDIKITKGHLVRHLGILREEHGLAPLKRGRKPKTPDVSTLTPAASCMQSQPIASVMDPSEAPCPVQDADVQSATTEATHHAVSQAAFPHDITRLKFIEVKGEWLDVTKMNIDDYLTVSKTIPVNAKIPEGMFDIIAAENRIRGMYERALLQYDAAIAKWKSSQ